MAEPNVKSQVDFAYYRHAKEQISKEFKARLTHRNSTQLVFIQTDNLLLLHQATTVLKYFHTRCETIIHCLNHTLSLRENFSDYFNVPKAL